MTHLPFHANQIPPSRTQLLRVDRDQELKACVDALDVRCENVFLWGTRGVGKTFLVQLIDKELRRNSGLLPVNADLLGLPGFGRTDPVAAFPEAVLLALCRTIWKEICGKPYSDLRERLDLQTSAVRLTSKPTRIVEKVYTQVMAAQRRARYEYSNAIGFSAGAVGEKKETGWIEQVQPPILPFEFLELCEELLLSLRGEGIERVIVLGDEANLLPLDQQAGILSRYVDLFAARQVQFLFVAGVHEDNDRPPTVPEGFEFLLRLNELEPEDSALLLEKMATSFDCKLEVKAVDAAIAVCGGNPRLLLRSLSIALTNGATSVGEPEMRSACSRLLSDIELHRRSFRTESKAGAKSMKRGKR